jgi:hypothetical protein
MIKYSSIQHLKETGMLNFRVLLFTFIKIDFSSSLYIPQMKQNIVYINPNVQNLCIWKYLFSHVVTELWFRNLSLYGKYKNIGLDTGQTCPLST